MPRAVWKGPYFSLQLLKAIREDRLKEGVKTFERSCTVIPEFIGAKLLIHTGNAFKPVVIQEEMIGMKVGHLAPTKKPFYYRHTNANKKAPSPK